MILLIGGCGFLGRSLTDYLVKRDLSVKIFDHMEPIERWKVEHPAVTYWPGDFTRIGDKDALFDNVTTVVHLVHSTIPSTSMEDIAFDAESNILPSIRLLETASRLGIKRFIFISSGGTVYGVPNKLPVPEDHPTTPLSAYGISKLAIEKYVQLYTRVSGLEGIVIRLSNPYGPHQLVGTTIGSIANFLLQVKRGKPIVIWGDGSTVRDYVYIDDVVQVMELIFCSDEFVPGVYNIGSGVGYSLIDIVNEIFKVTKIETPILFNQARSFDVPNIVLDISQIRKIVNWQPQITLGDGVNRLWNLLSTQDES